MSPKTTLREPFMNRSTRLREGRIREKAHTCTGTYTCNSTISTPVPVTGTITSRRAAPCRTPNVNLSARVTVTGLSAKADGGMENDR